MCSNNDNAEQPRASAGAYWRNLRQPMPAGRKIRLVVRNMGIRFKMRSQCCGHIGEPGC